MNFMKVNIKKLNENAVIPQYATDGSAGMDVTAVSVNITDDYIEYDTGLAIETPPGYVTLMFPRSSNSKKDLLLCNSVGICDSDYRGPLKFRFKRVKGLHSAPLRQYEVGDRIGQIMILPYPTIEFNEASELSDTQRGNGGFGSSGK